MALSQSVFRIYKCYIINRNIILNSLVAVQVATIAGQLSIVRDTTT